MDEGDDGDDGEAVLGLIGGEEEAGVGRDEEDPPKAATFSATELVLLGSEVRPGAEDGVLGSGCDCGCCFFGVK